MPTLLNVHHTPPPALQAMFEAVAAEVRPALTAAAPGLKTGWWQ